MDAHARGPVVRLLTAVLTTALALVGLVALTTATAPVANAAAGSISGTVTAAGTGTPLAGMTVVAFCNEDGDWYWCDDTIRDRKSTRLNSSHVSESRMPSSA